MKHFSPAIFLPLFAVCLSFASTAQNSGSNIVIPDLDIRYNIITDRSGTDIQHIKQTKTIRYRAERAAEKAVAYQFYDLNQTVDKAKAKGARPIYSSCISEGIFFDDSRICILSVPLEKVGSEAEAVFEVTNRRPDFGSITMLCENYPVRHMSLSYTMPASLRGRIDIAVRNLPESVRIKRDISPDGKDYVITLTADSLPEINLDKYSPSARTVLPHVLLTGFFKDVNELYADLHSYTVSTDKDSASVAEFARQLTAGCYDEASKISRITGWVRQNINYIAIEHGDLGRAPAHASEVLRNRYGDCKGSASLIKSMLQASGVDSRLVWVGTDAIPDDFTDVPMGHTGNHMIAAAMTGDSVLYLDGTVGYQDIGAYSPSIQGKQTLIENGSKPIVGRVPILPPEANTDSVVTEYSICDNRLAGTTRKFCSGNFKNRLLNQLKETDAAGKTDIMKFFINDNRRKCLYSDVCLTDDHDSGLPAIISASVIDEGAIASSGEKLYVNPNLFYPINSMLEQCDNRLIHLKTDCRCMRTRRTVIHLPENLTVDKLPQRFVTEDEFTEASVDYRLSDRSIECMMTLKVKKRIIPPDSMDSYRETLKSISKALNRRITLHRI